MIEGTGDIAKVLTPVDRNDRIYFASGVSNSQETRESEYKRELDLLHQQNKSKQLVYFSSLAIFYGESRYVRHKLAVEHEIKHNFHNYAIVRLGNIAWGDNPHTLINTFRDQIRRGDMLDIRDEYRYIVDKPEFLHWMGLVPDWNVEMNIPGRMMKVADIVKQYAYLEGAIK